MDALFDTFHSPEFWRAMFGLGRVALILALGLIVIAFAFYGRTRETDGVSFEDSKWIMLFASWRDSLIFTVLYISEALLFRFSDFIGLSQVNESNPLLAPFIVQPLIAFCLHILIFTIAILRIVALSRWLAESRKTGRS